MLIFSSSVITLTRFVSSVISYTTISGSLLIISSAVIPLALLTTIAEFVSESEVSVRVPRSLTSPVGLEVSLITIPFSVYDTVPSTITFELFCISIAVEPVTSP